MIINLLPQSGRVGTSSIAIAVAHQMADRFWFGADIVTADPVEIHELLCMLGLGRSDYLDGVKYKSIIETTLGVNIVHPDLSVADNQVVIHPKGVLLPAKGPLSYTSDIALLRNDYISLARFTQLPGNKPDGYVCCVEATNALTLNDVRTVAQCEFVDSWSFDQKIQRSIDAGLFVDRIKNGGCSNVVDLANKIIDLGLRKVTQGNEQENASGY